MKLFFPLVLALVCASAGAQNVLNATMSGQPLIYTDNGKHTGCGVRIVGIAEPLPGQSEFRSFDVSVNIYATNIALGKAIGEVRTTLNPHPRAARRVPLYGAWFRAEGDADAVALIRRLTSLSA